MPTLDDISKIVAYQRSPLAEMQRLYATLHVDLNKYLEQEDMIAEELRSLEKDFARLNSITPTREITPEQRAKLQQISDEHLGSTDIPNAKTYEKIEIETSEDFKQLLENAEIYLREHGIDPQQDPLLQILDSGEIAAIRAALQLKYKEVEWKQEDYIVVVLAGFMATLVDLLLVKIPGSDIFLDTLPQGYAMTRWIRERSQQIKQEGNAHKTDQSVAELSRMAEHDPIFAFIRCLVKGGQPAETPFSQRHTEQSILSTAPAVSEKDFSTVLTKVLLHLLSGVFTSAGIQPPFGRLTQFTQQDLSVPENPADSNISWTNVAGYMRQQGFDLNEFLMLGVVPATVEMTIKGYWFFRLFDHPEDEEEMHAKMTSMLMLGHTIALSGNLIKTGLLYHINPFALNWERMLSFFPVLFSWILESLQQEHLIRTKMDQEWVQLYETIEPLSNKK